MPQISNILKKIEAAGLVGRGGASYPTAKKWAAVKAALAKRKIGYIIVNGAEGEPGVKKDGYLIAHYPWEVINGVYLSDEFLGSQKIHRIYFFLNRDYYRAYSSGLKKVLTQTKYKKLGQKLEFIIKPEKLTYVSGEESALLNLLEGKKVEPSLRPPFPTEHGLHGHPTLINNTETFYNVSLVGSNKFKNERLYTIGGAVKRRGVYSLSAELTVAEVLRQTNNYPAFNFFVQVGGEASGEFLNSGQLDRPASGAGSIMIYDAAKTKPDKLLRYLFDFYFDQSCGNCTTCREGTYRLWELISRHEPDRRLMNELLDNLAESSFCALGWSLPYTVKSYFKNILKN